MNYIEDVKQAYKDGAYSINYDDYDTDRVRADHVFDEDKSVKWNREQVKIHNDRVAEEYKRRSHDEREMDNKLRQDTLDVINKSFGISADRAGMLYEYCYDRYHDCMDEFFDELWDLCDLVNKVIAANK